MPEDKPRGPGDDAPAPMTAKGADTKSGDATAGLPPVDFPTFVMSLASSALMHLGIIPGPGEMPVARNLALAKHTIDLLAMLQEKTNGNLTAEEAQLIEELLYDLRLRFVETSKAGPQSSAAPTKG